MKHLKSGPCGLYCGACGALDCEGCRSDKVDEWARQCRFRKCAAERGLAFCCDCADFPCNELHAFMTDKWPHHGTMMPNLEYIQKHGVEKWLEAQKKVWSCRSCGEAIFWYQRTCRCGNKLDAWDLPE